MSHARLRPSLHTALCWTLTLTLLVALVSLLLAPPFAAQRALRERMQELAFQKSRFATQLARLDAAANATAPMLDPGLLLAPAPIANATADLQARVSALLARHGARIASMQVLPPQPDTPLAVIGVRLQCQIKMTELQALLHALATHRPLLLQSNLTIQAQPILSEGRFRQTHDQLDVSLDLLAFGAVLR